MTDQTNRQAVGGVPDSANTTASLERAKPKEVADLVGVLYSDFTEPDLARTGYLIPISCGHNGQYSIVEKTIYEIHLTNAGLLE
jgi:hypothetical protein